MTQFGDGIQADTVSKARGPTFVSHHVYVLQRRGFVTTVIFRSVTGDVWGVLKKSMTTFIEAGNPLVLFACVACD